MLFYNLPCYSSPVHANRVLISVKCDKTITDRQSQDIELHEFLNTGFAGNKRPVKHKIDITHFSNTAKASFTRFHRKLQTRAILQFEFDQQCYTTNSRYENVSGIRRR